MASDSAGGQKWGQKQEYQRFYSACLAYNGGRSGLVTGGRTLEEALSEAFKNGTYYLGLGYDVEVTNVTTGCRQCSGTGLVTKRKCRQVTCPDCKGKGLTQTTVGRFMIRASPSVSIALNK